MSTLLDYLFIIENYMLQKCGKIQSYNKCGLTLIHVKFNTMNLEMNFKYNEINFNNEII